MAASPRHAELALHIRVGVGRISARKVALRTGAFYSVRKALEEDEGDLAALELVALAPIVHDVGCEM